MISALPAQYAKFITSLIGFLVAYLEMYGATWHLVPAVIALAASLGVMGVPNATKPIPPLNYQYKLNPQPTTAPPSWPGGKAPGTQ